MTFKRPLILGVGSIGSILCEKIVNSKKFEKLSVLDYDYVQNKNLKNSIFEYNDIGKPKIDVIKERFKNQINIDTYQLKFIETLNNYLFDCDVIIDCRDFLYDRKNIDIRLFVCNKSLIVDCRKEVEYCKTYEGNYFWSVTKDELDILLNNFTNLLTTKQIDDMIKNKEVNELNLRENSNIPIYSEIKDNNNVIVDNNSKITNPEDIFKLNKKQKIQATLYSGNSFTKSKTKTIDLNDKNGLQVINELEKLLPKFIHNNYLLVVSKHEIKIFPETGGA